MNNEQEPPMDEDMEDGQDDEHDVIVCPRCGLLNLAFRNHCRRCASPLGGSSEWLPGMGALEHTQTDQPLRKRKTIYPKLIILLALVCIFLPFSAGKMGLFAIAAAMLILFVAAWLISNGSGDTGEALAKTGAPCPFCGGITMSFDDVCAHCGEVIAPEAREDGPSGRE